MKVTNREVVNFHNNVPAYLQLHPESNKLAYALKKVAAKAAPLIRKFNDTAEDLRVEFSATDDAGLILRDEKGGFRFTKENLQKFNVAYRALVEQTVEIEPHIVTELPENFDEQFRPVFEGFVLTATKE